jgi:hypothetical protein
MKPGKMPGARIGHFGRVPFKPNPGALSDTGHEPVTQPGGIAGLCRCKQVT